MARTRVTLTRVTLTTAAILVGALVAQGIVLGLWNDVFGYFGFGIPLSEFFSVNMFWSLLVGLLHYVAFGVGVYLVIRFIAPLSAQDPWRQTITRGIIATMGGAIVAVLFGVIVSGIAAVTIGAYPFGYSLDAAVDPYRIQYGIQNVAAGALTPLLVWLPLTVLACVFLKLWLLAHAEPVETTDRVSVSAKP